MTKVRLKKGSKLRIKTVQKVKRKSKTQRLRDAKKARFTRIA